jgi:N-acyl-D-aspartate/D-glutamate deacylase
VLRDPELRPRLVAAARGRDQRRAIGAEPRPAAYDWIFAMDSPEGPHRSVADIAQERGVDPVEVMIDLIREGMAADLLVFDPETIAPAMPEVVRDLPAGARRLVQRARGIAATVVNGEVVLRDGKPTGALPGQLLRGPRARS